MLWVICDAPTHGAIIKEHGWTPPNAQLKGAHDSSGSSRIMPVCGLSAPKQDKTHRTTILRMGLPLAKTASRLVALRKEMKTSFKIAISIYIGDSG